MGSVVVFRDQRARLLLETLDQGMAKGMLAFTEDSRGLVIRGLADGSCAGGSEGIAIPIWDGRLSK